MYAEGDHGDEEEGCGEHQLSCSSVLIVHLLTPSRFADPIVHVTTGDVPLAVQAADAVRPEVPMIALVIGVPTIVTVPAE